MKTRTEASQQLGPKRTRDLASTLRAQHVGINVASSQPMVAAQLPRLEVSKSYGRQPSTSDRLAQAYLVREPLVFGSCHSTRSSHGDNMFQEENKQRIKTDLLDVAWLLCASYHLTGCRNVHGPGLGRSTLFKQNDTNCGLCFNQILQPTNPSKVSSPLKRPT